MSPEAAFDGGRLTSDGGITWLAEADGELGLCEGLARHIPDWRRREARHSLAALVRQRVYQIACGYEDQDDSDALREDPLLKLVCGSLPESGEDLASHPTICRMENAATARACYQMARSLVDLYTEQRGIGWEMHGRLVEKRGPPALETLNKAFDSPYTLVAFDSLANMTLGLVAVMIDRTEVIVG